MRVFLLDLWLDLREKRLAWLAILLVAGIVAVPIVLANDKTTTPAPAPTNTTATTASAAPVVESQSQSEPTDSKLQTFSPRDPFEPTSTAPTSGGGTTSSGGTSSGGGSSSTETTTTPSTGGGGATTGTQPSTGTTTPPSGTGNTTGETKTTLFTYTVDLRFGQGGDMKAYKNVKRLDLIPNDKNPKVVFLGVTTTAKTAVFLVDSNIGVDTGGRCRPSADECSFLYLRPDDTHDEALLTDSDGTVYHLRLLKITRVTVSSSNGSTTGSGNSGGNTNSNRSPAFTGQAKRKSASEQATVPGESAPPGEPDKRATFDQFFADSSSSK
jgi:uncharacterized membrane protein YgcG